MHENIRSVNRNFDSLLIFLNQQINNLYILTLTETWKVFNVNIHKLHNFDIIYNNSTINQNDGVLIFINKNLLYEYNIE